MSIFTFIKSHAVLSTGVVVVAVAGAVIGGRAANRAKTPVVSQSNIKNVSLIEVSTFSNTGLNVSADGTVESVSQVDIKSQASAPLATVNVAVGDTVYAGEAIAELQNADIRAQIDSAKAALTLAQGNYGGTRQSAIDAIKNAYLAGDSAIHTEVDPLILNPTGTASQAYTYISDSTLANKIRTERIDLGSIFNTWKPIIDGLSSGSTDSDIHAGIILSETNLGKVRTLLDDLIKGINDAATIASGTHLTILNGWQASLSAARTSVSASKNSLTSAESSLSVGSSNGSAAEAGVSAAEANIKNLQAQLAKTVFISPISGRIAALPLRTGELASPGSLIATIVGGGGLQIRAYVSDVDFERVQVGSKALIQGKIPGTVIAIAPSVNQTNKKVEIKIAVTNSAQSGLVVGQNVPVSIQAGINSPVNAVTYTLPIQDVKIIPGAAYVFTVDGDSKIVRHEVTLGNVQGDYVQVKTGITDDMKIVSPVYELEEGQIVNTQ